MLNVVIISTGSIWVLRTSHFFCTDFETTAVNCSGRLNLRSKRTPPPRSGSFLQSLGSGVKPSVKTTTSEKRSFFNSIGLGGPLSMSFLHCLREISRASSSLKNSSVVDVAYCLSDMDLGRLFQPSPRADSHQTSTCL